VDFYQNDLIPSDSLRAEEATCIVQLVRHSPNFCAWKDRKVVATDLRRIYSARAQAISARTMPRASSFLPSRFNASNLTRWRDSPRHSSRPRQ